MPNIQISNYAEVDRPLGRYGRITLTYLRNNHPDWHMILKVDGILMRKMHQVHQESTERIERLTQQMIIDNPMPATDDILERTRLCL